MRRGLVTMNLHRRRHTFCLALALCCSIISITSAEDFQFASEKEEEIQPMLAKPVEVVSKAQPIKSIYSKEKTHCPSSQNKIILSLVLRSHSWEEIVEKKRQKAINKLSKFFLVPKENFIIDDVGRADIHEMTSNAIRRGRNSFPGGSSAVGSRKLGRIGFLIGCGKTIFPEEKLIANTVAQQMKEKALDDISGLDFAWWAIWSKQHPTGRHRSQSHSQSQLPRRVKRQQAADGFGNDEEEDDYEDYYDDEDEIEPTEVPQHAHRHHHGDSSSPVHPPPSITSTSTSSSSSPKTSGGGDVGGDKKGSAMAAALPTTDSHSKKGKKLDGHQSAGAKTQTESNDQFDFTQADIRESVSQLESTISKTIENNEELKKEEESLLAKKASKHKKIDIERIVETELMLPDIEQMKSGRDVFRDDYVIEDVAVTPTVKKHFATKTTTRMPMTTLRTLSSSKKSTPSSSATTETTSKFIKSSSTSSRGLTTMMTSWPSTASTSKISKVEPTTTPRSTSATTPETSSINSVVSSSIDDDSSKEDNLSNQGLSPDTKSTPISSTTTRRTATTTEKMTTTPKSTTKKAATTTTEVTTTTTRASTTPPPTTTTTSVATPSTDAAAAAAPTQLEEFKKETVEEVSTISASNNPAVAVGHQGPAITRSSGGSSSPSTVATNQHPPNSKQNYILQPPLLTTIPTDGGASSNINSRQETADDDDEETEADVKLDAMDAKLLPSILDDATGNSDSSTISISSTLPATLSSSSSRHDSSHVGTPASSNQDVLLEEDAASNEEEEDDAYEYEDSVIITELPKSVVPEVGTSTLSVTKETIPLETVETKSSTTPIPPSTSSTTTTTTTTEIPSTTTSTTPTTTTTTTTSITTEVATTPLLELVTVPSRVDLVETTSLDTITSTAATGSSAAVTSTASYGNTDTTTLVSKITTPPTSVSSVSGGAGKSSGKSKEDTYEDNYDDEYDDELEEEATTIAVPTEGRQAPGGGVVVPTTESTTPEPAISSTVPSTSTTPTTPPTTTESTTPSTTTTTTTAAPTTTSTLPTTTELDEPTNLFPIIKNRIPKQAIIAGKVFSLPVPLETFYDNEDGNNLRLDLFDSNGNQLKHSSWIQFNPVTREIYGLPLEKDVSKWHYILQATDSGDKTVNETVDISVQQHKSHRSVNHEISLALRLQQKFTKNVDWQLQVIRGIAKVLGDVTLTNVVVREVRNSIQDPNLATFVYTNETLPKDRCPEEKLDELVAQLTETALNEVLKPDILVKSVQGQQIGQCLKSVIPRVKPTQSTIATKNFAPTTRNQVDRVNATVGHLLVFKVPTDTFYDPEDGEELKLKLLTNERNPLDQFHWLQFDSKNNEFYGIPRSFDVGQKEYLLIAEDREGLTATDALIVVVHQPHHKREQSVLFELTLDTTHEQFTIALAQRRFIERLAQVFGDANTNYIQIKNIRPIHHTGQIQVTFYNTTLYRQHQRCPDEEIEALRNILLYPDGTIRAKVREILGQEFSLQNVSLIPMGTCQGYDTPIHVTNEPEKAQPPPVPKDDYLLTFVLPAVIILAMLLIASLIACVLYRRRLTGKMELGTDEERKSFRSKGIPVIFQDELDEKPEIGNKSPVILKDEKPPLLPPSYSSTNNDGDNEDVDEYVPPPAVVMGGRESRGKSPVTPSYRRPPPYVSP
ncbi:uncharacterized protein LOC129754770 isoform X2 [Uranotaenia lowii]|uniref:uncharacterized protein LOC129754770 isoform X2 n=1 Tax=Uranotaenia lowii TaxID=190385 RepID=UPI00247A9BDD|nr:uncharacterized protein LOC129754770 isoform X2 [Uranotaenia lowii]